MGSHMCPQGRVCRLPKGRCLSSNFFICWAVGGGRSEVERDRGRGGGGAPLPPGAQRVLCAGPKGTQIWGSVEDRVPGRLVNELGTP